MAISIQFTSVRGTLLYVEPFFGKDKVSLKEGILYLLPFAARIDDIHIKCQSPLCKYQLACVMILNADDVK